MTAADVTAMTGAINPAIIVAGIVAIGGIVILPKAARWGIRQIQAMLGR